MSGGCRGTLHEWRLPWQYYISQVGRDCGFFLNNECALVACGPLKTCYSLLPRTASKGSACPSPPCWRPASTGQQSVLECGTILWTLLGGKVPTTQSTKWSLGRWAANVGNGA